jgi:hypothetical protein
VLLVYKIEILQYPLCYTVYRGYKVPQLTENFTGNAVQVLRGGLYGYEISPHKTSLFRWGYEI